MTPRCTRCGRTDDLMGQRPTYCGPCFEATSRPSHLVALMDAGHAAMDLALAHERFWTAVRVLEAANREQRNA